MPVFFYKNKGYNQYFSLNSIKQFLYKHVIYTTFKHSPPPEGCQPKADGVVYFDNKQSTIETYPPQNFSLVLDPRSLYTKVMRINGSQLKLPIIEALPQNAELLKRALELRKARNLPEVLFWMQVTKGRFHQIDFDRQKVIGNYIVDFYVKRLRLIIEIDGSSHIGKEVYDSKRQNYLESLGLRVYRISTGDIKYRLGCVLKELEEYIVGNYALGEDGV